MKSLVKVCSALALSIGVLVPGVASAAVAYAGNATYVGNFNPTLGEGDTFEHKNIVDGAFTEYYLFQINPAGDIDVDVNFTPGENISLFEMNIYSATSGGCALAVGTACATFTQGGLFAAGTTLGGDTAGISFTAGGAGFYLIEVKGTVSEVGGISQDFYTGNISTQVAAVPEPGTLALAAIGLLGIGGLARRRQS